MNKMRVTALFAGSVVFLLFGCLSAPVGPTDSAAATQSVETTVSEEVATEAIAEPEFERIVVKESYLFPEGDLDSYTEYEYDQYYDLLLEERLFDIEGLLVETKSYTYSGNAITEITVRDELDAVIASERFFYDEAGNLVIATAFDELNEVSLSSWYDYDSEGKRLSWTVTDSEDIILGMLKYFYDGKQVASTEVISPEGILEESIVYTYNKNGDLISEDVISNDGEILTSTKHIFRDGWLSETQSYRAGDLSASVRYIDNPSEGLITVEYRNADGGIQEIRIREYVKKEVTQ